MKCIIDIHMHTHTKEYLEAWRNRSRRNIMHAGAKARAKRKGIIFDIKLKDIPEVPDSCPVLNIPLKVNIGIPGWDDNSPSLDRICNEKGYVKDNLRIISNRANRLKCDATLEELEKIVLDARNIGH